MCYDVGCKAFQSFFIAKYLLHGTHRLFTCSYVRFGCSLLRTSGIIILYLLDLFGVECYLGNAWNILDVFSNFIVHRLLHGVAVHYITEHLNRFGDRCTCKADECGIRKRRAELFGIGFGYKSTDFAFINYSNGNCTC